jgi:nitrite reductase (NO-forming)
MTDRGINMIGIAIAIAALIVGLVALAEGGGAAAPAAAPVPATSAAAPAAVTPAAAPTEMAHAAPPAMEVGAPNVVRDPSDVPAPINRTEPETVQLTLTIRELVSELADGTTYTFWTFDETVPGPMLRVMEGDTVELTLVNPPESSMGHNIDLHAVNGPGGGASVTNVQPGESKTFTFKALNPGLYIYHCAFPPPWMHIAQGMYGGILVEPVGGLPPVDREFYVIQGEWYTTQPFGAQGHQDFDNTKANAELPEYYTFNGHVNALTEISPLQANVGETVRVYFGVGGPNIGSNFHIIGEVFDKVFTGAPETYIANEETWYVPPGSFAAFEFKIDVPGQYVLVDHALFRAGRGALGALIASGEHDATIYSPQPEGIGAH